MIYISCTDFIKLNEYDQVWGIVRSPKKLPHGFIWTPELSPSNKLYRDFLFMKNNGEWNETAFSQIYVPQFLKEIHRKDTVQKLNELYVLDRAGYKIAVCCFCVKEATCHRTIIAGLLQGTNCDIKGIHDDYRKYYRMYKQGW